MFDALCYQFGVVNRSKQVDGWRHLQKNNCFILHAYGPSVLDDVKKARAQLLDRKGRLRDCMHKLGMSMPEAALRRRIQAIRQSTNSVWGKAAAQAPALVHRQQQPRFVGCGLKLPWSLPNWNPAASIKT